MDVLEIDPKKIRNLRRNLLRWYKAHARELPWRAGPRGDKKPNPYHVMVSEAMLQQTQVATVIDYFNRFVAVFPTVASLAAADEQSVLNMWQGLGYYRRARHLHAAAKMVVDEFEGEVPREADELLKLPGVGPYSAGAIASIAYDQRAAIVDGNVIRILSRIFKITKPADETETKKRLWSIAEALVPAKDAGNYNQAMMELGAMICSPRGAGCLLCPVRNQCESLADDQMDVHDLPVMLPKKKPRAVTHQLIAVQRRDGKYLFVKRPAKGLWSNMFGLLSLEHDVKLSSEPDFNAIKKHLKTSVNLTAGETDHVKTFKHQTTHLTIHFELHVAQDGKGRAVCDGEIAWRRLDELDDLPLAKPQQKAVSLLRKFEAQLAV
ncbi:A/G-specific adenine glycosylase [Poriferisphaera sp. WC338]|uniref:A/G-specific adenine glycosylase n=1 Tax=Poriferisphaera sp. WC338 TaxID=3425129 RepID=UPI003D819C10